MPITKTVQIGHKPVMVRELTMEEVLTLFEEPDGRAIDSICRLLSICTDITRSELMTTSPSELTPLVDVLLEVNQAFFDLAERLGMPKIADVLRKKLLAISMLAFLPLSKPATEPESGNTPIPSS